MILTVTAMQRYLALPAYRGEMERSAMRLLRVLSSEQRLLGQFLLPVRGEAKEPDWYAYLPIADEHGREIRIETECDEFYTRWIHQTDTQTLPQVPERPSLHYTAPYGWLNDPNGLICVDGVYHLFHQHNPVGTMWGNISWGHAVSRDLIHYEWMGEALLPDEHGVMYSGSAIRNEAGAFGLPADAILFFYTSCNDDTRLGMGAQDEQRMAYSLDGGRTLVKYEGWCLPQKEKGNRDPKVFRHEESGAWIMTLYLADTRFQILRSEDLEHWNVTQVLDEPPMWECPDLIRLEEKWAFLSADGYYYIGDFDGYTFTKETPMQTMYGGDQPWLPYAAQSWMDAGDRVLSTSWLRVPNRGTIYTGVMSLPRELTLGRGAGADGGIVWYIRQSFAAEASAYVTYDVDGNACVDDSFLREQISADGRYYTAEVV